MDELVCIGCGACEHVCPSRPQPAIFVEGFERQRKVRPLGEAELLAEMKKLVAGGASCVAARDGVIVGQEAKPGVESLLKLHDDGKLAHALVAAARATGCQVHDGAGMLVAQAVETIKDIAAITGVFAIPAHLDLFAIMAEAAGFGLDVRL